MDPQELLDESIEIIQWIQDAGKESRVLMFADSVEKDYANQSVSIWFGSAISNALRDIDGEAHINDLDELIRLEDEEAPTLHPPMNMPWGAAMALVATSESKRAARHFSSHKSAGIRALTAAVTHDAELLNFLSYDPCMVVRSIVAVNRATNPETKARLFMDPFRGVRRRTLYSDNKAITEFDAGDSKYQVAGRLDLTPNFCGCSDIPSIEVEFTDRFIEDEDLFMPLLPSKLSGQIRKYGDLYWGTQPFPSPFEDYILESLDYLKGYIPDHYAISHSGHGINSWSLNFRCALGELAILGQVGWSGAYMESAQCKKDWNDMAQGLDEILQGKKRLVTQEFKRRRFLIVYSNFRFPTKPELWEFRDTEWVLREDYSSLSEIYKIVNIV